MFKYLSVSMESYIVEWGSGAVILLFGLTVTECASEKVASSSTFWIDSNRKLFVMCSAGLKRVR